jgi:hypothetical protein
MNGLLSERQFQVETGGLLTLRPTLCQIRVWAGFTLAGKEKRKCAESGNIWPVKVGFSLMHVGSTIAGKEKSGKA